MQRDPRWAALRDRLEAALNTVGSLELYSLHMIEAELSEASSDSPQGRQEAPGLAQDEGAAKPCPQDSRLAVRPRGGSARRPLGGFRPCLTTTPAANSLSTPCSEARRKRRTPASSV